MIGSVLVRLGSVLYFAGPEQTSQLGGLFCQNQGFALGFLNPKSSPHVIRKHLLRADKHLLIDKCLSASNKHLLKRELYREKLKKKGSSIEPWGMKFDFCVFVCAHILVSKGAKAKKKRGPA